MKERKKDAIEIIRREISKKTHTGAFSELNFESKDH